VAHMVHMSSHEYERIGYYAKGVSANEHADRSLATYDSLAKGLLPQVHVPHYFAVDAYCALSGAMYKKAIHKSMVLRHSVKPTSEQIYMQYQYMFPQLTMVRMGKWMDLLNDTTTIDPEWTYAGLLNDFAKGIACSKTGKPELAEKYLLQLKEKKEDKKLKEKFVPYASSPYEVAEVAENILQATILAAQKNPADAIAAFRKAILAEDSLIYSEPKVWMIPARQYLGAYYLQIKKPVEAEKIYREDLSWNPGNGWSLLGLYQALNTQGKTTELSGLRQRYTYSFSGADILPVSSAY
jgi:tetratricopeptide (TPR) repeat protein